MQGHGLAGGPVFRRLVSISGHRFAAVQLLEASACLLVKKMQSPPVA